MLAASAAVSVLSALAVIGLTTSAHAGESQPAPAGVSQTDVAPPSPGRERLELGAALDSEDGVIGSAYVGKNNLVPGMFTFATFRYARETRRGRAGLIKPDLLGKGIDAGVDVNYRRDAYDDQGFAATTYGIEPYLRFNAAHGGGLTTGLGYRVQTIDDLAADGPPSFRRDAGTRSGLYLRVCYTLDKLIETNRLTLSVGVDNHAYNLGAGSAAFWQSEGWARTKVAIIPEQLSVLNIVRVGYMRGFGDDSPSVADRFFMGDQTRSARK